MAALYDALPSAQLAIVANTSHGLPFEKPAFVAQLIAEFLDHPNGPQPLCRYAAPTGERGNRLHQRPELAPNARDPRRAATRNVNTTRASGSSLSLRRVVRPVSRAQDLAPLCLSEPLEGWAVSRDRR
jgi:hypothetical protein